MRVRTSARPGKRVFGLSGFGVPGRASAGITSVLTGVRTPRMNSIKTSSDAGLSSADRTLKVLLKVTDGLPTKIIDRPSDEKNTLWAILGSNQ